MTTNNRPLRVFLCHSSADKPAVRELYQKLRTEAENWIDPWLDKMKILPGQNWRIVIEEAVEASDIAIICLSNHAVNKEGFIQREIRYAYDLALEKPDGVIFLIPLRLEECEVPRGMRSLQWVDYFGAEKEEQYSNLLEAMKLRHKQKMLNEEKERNSSSKLDEKPVAKEQNATEKYLEDFHKKYAKPLAEYNLNKLILSNEMEFMRVPAGRYITGNKEQREIEIPYDYWMGRFLVTNEDYYQYVKSKSINHPVSNWMKKKDHPVAFVSWFDAVDYINWLNLQCKNNLPDGKILRLPIRFEWEKAARGLDGRSYPWGNEFDKDKCNSWEGGGKGTTPVGAYSPIGDSPFGCSDMWGNVRVWAQEVAKVRFPEIPDNVDMRVTCGISYNNAGKHPISIDSFGEISEHKNRVRGFRLVIGPPLSK